MLKSLGPIEALTLLVLIVVPGFAYAADRLKVAVPPPGQGAAEQLVGSLASACNSGDFIDFTRHFTPSHMRKIRGRMEDVFVKHQPRMDIRQVTLLSEDTDRISFAVRYAWHEKEKPEQVLVSKVIARRLDGEWRIDGETVKSLTHEASAPDYAGRPVVEGVAAGWDPYDPPAHLIDPRLEELRGDIGIQPGRGCANGRCVK